MSNLDFIAWTAGTR